MPISKLRPPKHIVRNYYKNSGMAQQSAMVDNVIKQDAKKRAEHFKTHRDAQVQAKISGKLCRSLARQ